MSIRAQILAETIARLEAERFQPMSPELPPAELPPITPAQARRNAQLLLDALDDDRALLAWVDRETGAA